jgi:hypothetical protein
VKKFRLLLLDANVVIEISRHDLWDLLTERCEIYLSGTVLEEAQFFDDEDEKREYIDLAPLVNDGTITEFSITPSQLASFREQFGVTYFEKLDPGETESLAYLFQQSDKCQICSADKIVFRILGCTNRAEQGISLEEVLGAVGLGRKLGREFSKEYREQWTRKGFQEGFAGLGLQDPG